MRQFSYSVAADLAAIALVTAALAILAVMLAALT